MKNTKPPGRLVEVTWMDSCSPSRKWQDPSISKEYGPSLCFSVGWMTKRDKDTVIIASSYGPDEVGDVTAIPAVCVKKIRRLK